MKETTRQLILLVGVLTLLTSGLVVSNTARTAPGEETNLDSGDAGEDPPPPENDTENRSVNDKDGEEEPRGIIGKSIRGFELMYRDMSIAVGAISASNSSDTP